MAQFYGRIVVFFATAILQLYAQGKLCCASLFSEILWIYLGTFCIILYISVCIGPVNISPETSIGSAGEYLNLSCSVDIRDINSLPQNMDFEWFYGLDNSSLPANVSVSNESLRVINIRNESNHTYITYTSTLQLSPLNQSNAGAYTCRLRGNKTLAANATVFVNIKAGVSLWLRGRKYENNSNISVTDIGEGDEAALLCITDFMLCCRKNNTPNGTRALGDWYYPNRSFVLTYEYDNTRFYKNRGLSRVRLHHRNDTSSLGPGSGGLFCCEIPDGRNMNVILCANIGKSLTLIIIIGIKLMHAHCHFPLH